MQEERVTADMDKSLDAATVQDVEATGVQIDPEQYPKFEEGEVVNVKGFAFEVMRFNASTIVMKPRPTKTFPRSARRCMYHLRGDLGEYKY